MDNLYNLFYYFIRCIIVQIVNKWNYNEMVV